MDDIDELDEKMRETLDALDLEPELVEMLRAHWMHEIEVARQARSMH